MSVQAESEPTRSRQGQGPGRGIGLGERATKEKVPKKEGGESTRRDKRRQEQGEMQMQRAGGWSGGRDKGMKDDREW